MKPPRLAVYGLTAGLLGGGGAGLLLTGTTLAGAQTSDSTTTTAPAAGPAATRGGWAKDALAPLVADGTITQAQADAVLEALQAARPGPGHGKGRRHGLGHAKLDAVAPVLGMTVDELRTALRDGQSLADLARAKGVDAASVVDALAARLKARLDERVAEGKHTQAEADEMLAEARTRIEAFVNGEAAAGGPGFRFGPGHHGRHGRGMGGPPADGSGGSGSTTTTTT